MFSHRCARCDVVFASDARHLVFCPACRSVRRAEASRRHDFRRAKVVPRKRDGRGRCRRCGAPMVQDGICAPCRKALSTNRCARCETPIPKLRCFCAPCALNRRRRRWAEKQRTAEALRRPTENDLANGVEVDRAANVDTAASAVPGDLYAPSVTKGGWVEDG